MGAYDVATKEFAGADALGLAGRGAALSDTLSLAE
jgi:hypothetical protein